MCLSPLTQCQRSRNSYFVGSTETPQHSTCPIRIQFDSREFFQPSSWRSVLVFPIPTSRILSSRQPLQPCCACVVPSLQQRTSEMSEPTQDIPECSPFPRRRQQLKICPSTLALMKMVLEHRLDELTCATSRVQPALVLLYVLPLVSWSICVRDAPNFAGESCAPVPLLRTFNSSSAYGFDRSQSTPKVMNGPTRISSQKPLRIAVL